MSPQSVTRRETARANPSAPKVTEIAEGSKVVGEISGAVGLRVLGEVEGHVKLDSEVEVGASGLVRGQIEALRVRVSGRVIGNVRGRESVSIEDKGSLEGDVVSPRMSISDGAFFKGKVEMDGESGARKSGPQSPAAPSLG